MDRRQFLASLLGVLPTGPAPAFRPRDAVFAAYANSILPARKAIAAGLEPYTGTWTRDEAAHLLRRTLFGFTRAELERAISLGAGGAVDALLDLPASAPEPPLVVSATEDTLTIGTTWVDQPYISDRTYERLRNLQSWSMGLLMEQDFSIREKMMLFWQNHFATEWRIVYEPHHLYRHLAGLRTHCLGNFKTLARNVTLDPAMLRYLNGNTNTKSNPNENYARELQELFTIGKGPEVAPGNYTNYTEDDVKAAAKVLTGWRDVRDTPDPQFRATQHDATDKTFSAAYGGTVIRGRTGDEGAQEIDDLIEMIFAQAETARHLCRKLYRFFVYYVIDAEIEARVIQPMADLLVAGNWNVGPVVALLLKSAHFHDHSNRGCFIKTPLDLVAGTIRSLEAPRPGTADLALRYQVWTSLADQAGAMQMEILSPPNVAGWPAYYQDPVYYEDWISSDTLPRRIQFTDRTMGTKGYQISTWSLIPDLIGLAASTSAPSDLPTLVTELSAFLFPIPITPSQSTYLQGILLGGAPDYEWSKNWGAYEDAPTDATKKSVVESRLRSLFKAMMAMAEYQLC